MTGVMRSRAAFALTVLVPAWALAAPSVAAPGAGAAVDPAAEEAGVVALVNGEAIRAEDLERQLAGLHAGAAGGERGAFDLDRLLFRVVNDTLIGQEARALGMDEEPSVADRVTRRREELAIRRLEREEIDQHSVPEPEEVRRLFEEQYRRATFRVVTAYERDGAEELREALDAGADMAALAAERSVDPYRLRGGLVEDLARIDLQREVAETVFALDPGELAGPLATDLGWSVFRVESFAAADPERFPKLERTVASLVRQRKAAARREALAAELRQRHPVTTDEAVVAALAPERLPDGRLVPPSPEPSAVVARLGESAVITAERYAQALLARWKGVRNVEAARAAAPIILDRLIESELLRLEALARGYGALPEVERALHAYETQLLVPRFLEEVVGAGIEISEEEKRAHYETHRESFRRPPRVRIGQITVASREEAERLAGLLRGGTDFAWLARQQSLDAYKDQGGDRGWMVPQMGADDINRDLLEAAVGEVLDPVAAAGEGWLVLRITDRQEQGIYSYQEVSGNVREAVFGGKFERRLDEFMTKLRERSEIEIREEALAALAITGRREEEPHGEGGGAPHDG